MKYLFIFLWIGSIVVLYSQSQVAHNELPDLIQHKSEMMPKEKFLWIVYGTAIIFNLIFAVCSLALSKYSKILLPNLLNIPNKDYWFDTPERLKEVKNKINCGFLWFCLILNGIFWYIIDLTIRSERAGTSQPVSAMIIILILAGFFAGAVYHYYAYRIPKQ